jgi:hypothetical protein
VVAVAMTDSDGVATKARLIFQVSSLRTPRLTFGSFAAHFQLTFGSLAARLNLLRTELLSTALAFPSLHGVPFSRAVVSLFFCLRAQAFDFMDKRAISATECTILFIRSAELSEGGLCPPCFYSLLPPPA